VSRVLPDIKIPNYIHSCSYDKSVHTYDLKTDKKVNFHQAKNGQILDMDQRKDNSDLITCGANTPISYWDLKNFQANAEIEFPFRLLCLSVSPSGQHAVYGCENGDVIN
jgi:WD40 repeat protein